MPRRPASEFLIDLNRLQISLATGPVRYLAPTPALLPPAVGAVDGNEFHIYDPIADAIRDGHPLLALMRLRQEAADMVEFLLEFLDITDGPDDDSAVDDYPIDDEELEADDSDWEPSLGRPEYIQQTAPLGCDDDREVSA